MGAGLIEVLIGLVMLMLATLGSLGAFAYGLGSIRTEGNRRAAVERGRQRLEQLLAVSGNTFSVLLVDTPYWAACAGDPCVWTMTVADPDAPPAAELVSLGADWPSQPMETSVQWLDDPAAGTAKLDDVLELSVKVWYTERTDLDTDEHRVHVRTLHAP